MRTIRRSARFKKDYKRESKGQYRSALTGERPEILDRLARYLPLPASARDHALTGDQKTYRDCHVKPDLVLIYRISGEDELLLARLGSHSELDL